MLENDGKLEEIEGKANNMTEQVLWRCVHYLSLSVHTHDARIDRIQRTVVFHTMADFKSHCTSYY